MLCGFNPGGPRGEIERLSTLIFFVGPSIIGDSAKVRKISCDIQIFVFTMIAFGLQNRFWTTVSHVDAPGSDISISIIHWIDMSYLNYKPSQTEPRLTP